MPRKVMTVRRPGAVSGLFRCARRLHRGAAVHRSILAAGILCLAAACSKSPTAPSADAARSLLGQAVNALDGAPAPGLTVQADRTTVTTDGEGHFTVEVRAQGAHDVTIRGGAIVERQTTMFGPTADRARVSLIPAGFDLAAFDEMFRTSNARLQRWTSRPSLVVLGSVMRYRSGNLTEYEATEEQMSDEEVSLMIEHLTEGLALLTGGTYTTFASVTVERPSGGSRTSVTRDGHVVVGRYNGIVSLANTIGYGQWAELPNGTITAGALFLDREFDRSDARRRLLRIHELGHALGYQHVRSRTSIMNPSIGPVPTDFDRAGAIIAFQRPPGNRSPDVDPRTGSPASVSTGGGQWMPPVFCR